MSLEQGKTESGHGYSSTTNNTDLDRKKRKLDRELKINLEQGNKARVRLNFPAQVRPTIPLQTENGKRIWNKARKKLDSLALARPTIPIYREKEKISLEQGKRETKLVCSSSIKDADLDRKVKMSLERGKSDTEHSMTNDTDLD